MHSLGETNEVEFVGVPFAVDLGHDVLVVVVPQGTTELVVVHVRLALPFTPTSGNLVWVDELEFSVRSLPRDAADVLLVRQQLQKELPQLDLTASCNLRIIARCVSFEETP